MNWQIPAKTFLVGEYAAIAEESAIILTTKPFFELTINPEQSKSAIHPDSPAGIWCKQQNLHLRELEWQDLYQGIGGLGASSAQFVGCYLAACERKQLIPSMSDMLSAYYESSWSGLGLRPSGYDVIAQSQGACVFINKHRKSVLSLPWVFQDLSFFIVHTRNKLATHEHLKSAALPSSIHLLSSIVDQTKHAFENNDSQLLIASVNNYYEELKQLDLVHPNSLLIIEQLKKNPFVLAIKGCGALGSDTLLLFTKSENKSSLEYTLQSMELTIIASETQLTVSNQSTLVANQL